ncbi:MAG: transporter substrate-binding domain-containing protein, partial [Bacteroidota bacterium]
VDFSQAVNPSGTGIAVGANSLGNTFQVYWRPILTSLLQLIGSLLFVLLLSGTIVWLVERQYNAPPSDKKINGLADGLWWSAVTMTTVGYGDKVPASRVGKVLGIIWIFTSIILLSLFTANASAIFTSAKLEGHIRTVEDLHGIRVGAQTGSSGAEFLVREQVNYQAFPQLEEALEKLLAGDLDAVVSNVPVLKYYNHSTRFAEQLAISPDYLLKNNMGIAVQDDSPYREDIDRILLKKIAEPRWQKAVYKYLGE